jgi:hypothetical protein
MKNLKIIGLLKDLGGILMTNVLLPAGPAATGIEKLIGEAMKILSLKYNSKTFSFEIECIMPGHNVPSIYQFHKSFFPNYIPVPLLEEMVQVGENVQIWIKEEALLKSEGWKEVTANTLKNPDSPFVIGKGKKVYLGGSHKGVVCLNDKFQPFVSVKGYRFAATEIKCILRLDDMFSGKNATIVNKAGSWEYSAEKQILTAPPGLTFDYESINSIIDLLRRARLI